MTTTPRIHKTQNSIPSIRKEGGEGEEGKGKGKKGKERRREGEGERKEGSKQARVKEKKKNFKPKYVCFSKSLKIKLLLLK